MIESGIWAASALCVATLAYHGFMSWLKMTHDVAGERARWDALSARVDVHEGALKNALTEIHAKFAEHDDALVKVTTEAATAVAGTMDAMSHVQTWGRG